MKEYNSVLLEDEEAQALQDIARLNNNLFKFVPFRGEIDDSLEGFYFTEYVVFTYINVLLFC